MDIILEEDRQQTGFLAQTVEEYANAILQVLRMPETERLKMAAAARKRAALFSEQKFYEDFKSGERHKGNEDDIFRSLQRRHKEKCSNDCPCTIDEREKVEIWQPHLGMIRTKKRRHTCITAVLEPLLLVYKRRVQQPLCLSLKINPFGESECMQKGVGPSPIPIEEVSLDKLVDAINFMLDPQVKQRAVELAKSMENEDGVKGAVNAFHKHYIRHKHEIQILKPHVSSHFSIRRRFGRPS